ERNGFAEESWVGESIRIGPEVVLRVEKANRRCKVTTMKQDDLPYDGKILDTISQKNSNVLGVMCSVVMGGIVAVGDELDRLSPRLMSFSNHSAPPGPLSSSPDARWQTLHTPSKSTSSLCSSRWYWAAGSERPRIFAMLLMLRI